MWQKLVFEGSGRQLRENVENLYKMDTSIRRTLLLVQIGAQDSTVVRLFQIMRQIQ